MKLTLPTLALSLAACISAQYTNESAPFHLVLVSDDESINGETLSACHVGAAIESLCLSNSKSLSKPNPIAPSTFHFNTSDTITTPNATLGTPGILTYWLETSTIRIPSGLELFLDPTTNFALPLLFAGSNSQTVAFGADDLLNIQGYVNYKVSPPTSGDYAGYYRWWSCATYFTGYEYVNLVWGLGDAAPETPGCSKVGVKRVFI